MKGWLKGVLKQSASPAALSSVSLAPAHSVRRSLISLIPALLLSVCCRHDEPSDGAPSPPATVSTPPASASLTVRDAVDLASHTLHPSPSGTALPASPPAPALSPSLLSPAVAALSPHSPSPYSDHFSQKELPAVLGPAQKLISSFLSKSRHSSHAPHSALPADLLSSLAALTAHPSFDASKLGTDGVKAVTRLTELLTKAAKGEHGAPMPRSALGVVEVMSAAVHEAHDMTGFEALRALFLLLVGPSKGHGGRVATAPFSAGYSAAVKGHLPSALVEILMAGAGVQLTASGQSTAPAAPPPMKKLSSMPAPLAPAASASASSSSPSPAGSSPTALSVPGLSKESQPSLKSSSSALSDCEFQCFTLLAVLCSHDHTGVEELIAQHKVDTLLHLASVVGPSSFTATPVTAVFHSNLTKLVKVLSKAQRLVKGVPKAIHETGVLTSLIDLIKSERKTDAPPTPLLLSSAPPSPSLEPTAPSASSVPPTALTPFQLAYDGFDLLTTFLVDSFPHSPMLLDDFERHDGYEAILHFLHTHERGCTSPQHVRTVARRLVALITIGYSKLDSEQDVLPFNLPPSSRTAAAYSLTASPSPSAASPAAAFSSPSAGKLPLSATLATQPSLPDTHGHVIGALPTTPSIARIRGHARNSSAGALSPHSAFLASSSGGRPVSSSSVRNLEAVQLLRDVFLQVSSSSLRLHVLSNLEFVFTSAAQLHALSSTNFTSRLLQSLQSFSTPVQNALLQSLQLIVTHTHNDFIPFKELCALNVTLTSDLTRASLSSILSVIISLDSMLDYDQLRYQHLLREAGVLDVMITNINLYYTQFAVAYESRYDPLSRGTHHPTRNSEGTPNSPFSPQASALSTLRLEVKRKRGEGFGQGTPSASPSSTLRLRVDGEEKRDGDGDLPSPQASPAVSGLTADQAPLSVTQIVRVVTAGLDVLTILLRDNANNQELFSTTTGPAVLLSFTVYPPLATPALHLVELLLQSHYQRLESMTAPPPAVQGAGVRDKREDESKGSSASSSISLEGMMASNAPKTVQALQLLGDCYMLAILHLLFSSLPSIAFEVPFYRTPPSDPALLKKPSHVSLATHPELRTFFPLPTRTSAMDTPAILRIGRLLHLVRRALSSSYYGQLSFGRMRGFERTACLLKGFTVKQLQLSRGELPIAPIQRQKTGGSDGMMSSATPPPSLPPPSTSHSAALFLMQEVVLTFILAVKGNDRNSRYPFPKPLPSHFHLSDPPSAVGFHAVGYRRLGRLLLSTGVIADDDGVAWTSCADLVANWMFWLSLEYLPADHELINTPSLPCTLSREQWQAQVEAELSEEQNQIHLIMDQPLAAAPPLHPISSSSSSSSLPPLHSFASPVVALAALPPPPLTLRVNTEEPSSVGWSCWWEESEQSIEFSTVLVNKLVLSSPGTVYHPLALRLVARFLPFTSQHLQRRLLTLLLLLTRSNATNAIALGQADVIAPLIRQLRPVLLNVNDVRHPQLLDLLSQMLPFTPGSAALHALFGAFESPARFPSSVLSFLADMATRSAPMPYVLLEASKDVGGVRVASIANAKWPPSNGYTLAVWLFIENTQALSINAGVSRAVDTGRKSPAVSPAPGPQHRHHLSVAVSRDGDGVSPMVASPAKPPVRKMSASLPSHPPVLSSGSKPMSGPPSPAPPSPAPSSQSSPPSSAPTSSSPSAQSFHVLRIDSDDGRSMFDLLYNPLMQQLALKTHSRSSYVFSGIRLVPGRWHHLAIAHSSSLFQGSWCHLYVNGQHKIESKIPYIGKAGASANVTAIIGGSVSSPASTNATAAESTVTAPVEGDVGKPPTARSATEMLQVPGHGHGHERARSNSVSLTVSEKEDGSPLPGLGLVSSPSPPPGSGGVVRASTGTRWRFASFLLLDDVLPEPVVKSLFESGPRTSAIVYGGSRPAVVDTLAPLYPLNKPLNLALDQLQTIVAKVSKRAQWNAITPLEEAAVAAISKRPSTILLDLDQAIRVWLPASPAEAAARSVSGVVTYDRVLLFFHAANGHDAAAPAHTCNVEPRQFGFSILNGGPPGVCSDARLTPQSAALVQARPFVDRLKQVGGMRRLLALVSKIAHTSENAPDSPGLALRSALTLIAQAVRRQPSNHREMEAIGGYRLLGHLLKLINKRYGKPPPPQPRRGSITSPYLSRAASPTPPLHTPTNSDGGRNGSTLSPGAPSLASDGAPVPVLDCVSVEILFSLVGLSDSGSAGLIHCVPALNELLLDFHIWRDCPLEVQLYLLQGLFNSICIMNADKEHNVALLRDSRIVGWLISLASDVHLHPDVLQSCVSIVRELMLHQLLDHELHLVADFAATNIMSDSRATEPQSLLPPPPTNNGGTRRSPVPVERPSVYDTTGVTVISSDDGYGQDQSTPASINRRAADDALPPPPPLPPGPSMSPPPPAVGAGDGGGFKVHFGSRVSARVKGLFIEMLLDVLRKIRGSAKQLAIFVKRIDWTWLYAVLHSGDPQSTHQHGRHARKGSIGRVAVLLHGRAAGVSSGEGQSSAILALKLLMLLLEDSHLFSRFKHSPGFASLPPLLLPHCHQGQVFSILLSMMMGKSLQDVPVAPLDVNAVTTSDWTALLASALSEGPPVVEELVPVVIAVLRECIELTKFHQSSAPPVVPATVSQPMSPARGGGVLLEPLEPFERSVSAGSVQREGRDSIERDEADDVVQVVADLSDEHLESFNTSHSLVSPVSSARHQRTLTTMDSASFPNSPLGAGGQGELALTPSSASRPQSARSPSRRATFNPHESGNVAATKQTTRKKVHHRPGSLHVLDVFSPSHQLLAAAADAAQPPSPKSPLSSRISDLLHGKESKDDDGAEAAPAVGEGGEETSPSSRFSPSRRLRHRGTLTISTVAADSTTRSAAAGAPPPAGKEAQAEEATPLSLTQDLVITTETAHGANHNAASTEHAAAGAGAAEPVSGRPASPPSSMPRTPGSDSPPLTPDAVITTSGLRALRTINNAASFHQLSHFRPPEPSHPSRAASTDSAALYSLHYHSHIVHQPNIKAMNGTITFLTKLFNVSEAFRSLAGSSLFTRQLVVAIFASATMGTQPIPTVSTASAVPGRKRSTEEVRSAHRRATHGPVLVQHASEPSLFLGSFAESGPMRHRVYVSDDPSVPTAPLFDPFVYAKHERGSVSQTALSRQSSSDSQLSPNPDGRDPADRSPLRPTRVRKGGSMSNAPSAADVAPERGTLANIDTADMFRHSTSVFLFQLLREIVVQNLLQRTKGTQMLIDVLDQAPFGSTPQQRIRYQTMLLAGLPSRLQKALAGQPLLSNSKLTNTLDRLTALLVERLQQGLFINGGPSTFQFIVHVLSLPDCRAVVGEFESAGQEKGAGGSRSSASFRPLRPLYEALNETILYVCEAYSNGKLSAEDLLQINQTLLDNARCLLGEHNGSKTWLACLLHHLYRQLASEDEQVSSMAIRMWSWLLKNKLGSQTMMELLKATIITEDSIKPQQSDTAKRDSTGSLSTAHSEAPSSPSSSLSPSPPAPAAEVMPASPTTERPAFAAPSISRRRVVDLYDDGGRGGFDHLLQMVDGAGEAHWMKEFRDWLFANERIVRAVFAVTLTPHWVSYQASERMASTALWSKAQRHVLQDVERHRLETAKRMKEAAQMEVAVLERLRITSNVEVQRLLRRDQRSAEIERQATKAWADAEQRLTVTAMLYSPRDYRMPSTAERLRKMREELTSKRSWLTMMGWEDEAEEEDAAATGDDPAIHIDEVQPNDRAPPTSPGPLSYPLSSSSLALRQPWRVEPSEGPARVRRRLCEVQPMRPDVPLYSHPYRLWEDERRSSMVGEDSQKVDGDVPESSQVRVEGEEDPDSVAATEADVPMDAREDEQVEVVVKEELNAEDAVQDASDGSEGVVEPSDSQADGGEPFSRHTSVSISADGEIISDGPIDPESGISAEVVSTASSPQGHRPELTIDTSRRTDRASATSGARVEDLMAPLASSTLSSLSRPEGSPHSSASPLSTTSAGSRSSARARGMSFTATSIPAVDAEPKRRKARARGAADEHSPHSPPSPASAADNAEGGTAEATAPVKAATTGALPLLPSLMPAVSAPILPPESLVERVVSISVDAPQGDVPADSRGGTAGGGDSRPDSPSGAPGNSARRGVLTRPRSLTAEDALAPNLLIPAAAIPSSSSATSLSAADKQPASPAPGSQQQPLTPAVPLPGSNEDDEALEGDELVGFLEEERVKLILSGDDIHYHWNAVRVDGMEEVRCILCLCEHAIFLIDNYEIGQEGDIVRLQQPPSDSDLNASTSHSSPNAPATAAADSTECRRWPYIDVVEVAKRRYLLRPAALELFFSDGTNHLLVLNVDQRESVFQHLVDKSPAVRSSRLFKATGHFLTGDLSAAAMQSSLGPLSKQWQAGELSNFEYLVALNSVAGRTYNDLSQYPVFPWVVRDYDSAFLRLHDPSTFRDLSKPMGALTEPRAAIFRQRYKESQTLEDDAEGYHYATHLSTAAVVLYYLLRCEPYTQHAVAFQSGRFDRPDRLFHSIKQSYLSASQQNVMDVKELIPEFFCSADFLVNGNALKLGVRQDELRVNDVLLPRWAQGSARQFVRLHRAALESEYVSAHLHHWVDLVFGYQQRGKEAVNAQNVFHYLTYAGHVDVDQIADPMRRAAVIETIRSFGQTPTQLFTTPHPPRKVVPRMGSLFRSTLLHRFRATKTEMVAHPVGSLFVAEADNKVYATRPGILIVPTSAAPSTSAHSNVLRLLASRRARLPPNKAKSVIGFVAWGFPDRSLRTGLVGPNQGPSGFAKADAVQFAKVYLNMHEADNVGVVAVPEVDSGILVTAGAEDCVVTVWKAEPLSTGLFGDYAHHGSLYGHSQPVTCLAVSRAFSLIASGSGDSTVILWDLNRREAVRQLRVVPFGAVVTWLSFDNVSGCLAIASRSPDTLSLVDVNGALLAQYPDIRRMEAHQHARQHSRHELPSHADLHAAAAPSADASQAAHHPHAKSTLAEPASAAPAPAPGYGHAHSASLTGGESLGSLKAPRASTGRSPLSMPDPISALYVVDAAGYHFLNSLLLVLTGHKSGKVRLWYVTFDNLNTSSSSSASSASNTLRATTSNLPAPSAFAATPTSPLPAEVVGGTNGGVVKKAEEEVKTEDGPTTAATEAAVIRPPPLVALTSSAELSPGLAVDPSLSVSPSDDKDRAAAASPAAFSSASSASPAGGSLALKGAAAAPYSGDVHIPEEFDGPPVSLMSPLSPAPPQPPARSWHLRPVAEWARHTSPVTALYVTSDCSSVYSGDSHGHVVHWQLPVSEEAKVNVSGLMGVDVPPLDAQCACKAQEKGKVNRAVVRRYCVCHPRSCTQVVCDACVLDHIRARHSPAQHRIAVLAAKQRAQKAHSTAAAAVAPATTSASDQPASSAPASAASSG